ncbi:MAG: glycoside hydrolase family 5 protein [Dictyoglomaceae bacterium]
MKYLKMRNFAMNKSLPIMRVIKDEYFKLIKDAGFDHVRIPIHHYKEIMQEPEKHKERFLKLWEQIADHYKNYPESLWFELLNEPCFNLKSNLWNQYLKEAIKVIRKTNPTRKIIVGPTEWNHVYKLSELEISLDDKNLIVTFHYYNPFNFTRQGAKWVNPTPPVGVKWMGTDNEKKQ